MEDYGISTHIVGLLERRLDTQEELVRQIISQQTETLVQTASLALQIRLGIWLAGALITGGVALAWKQLANIQKILSLFEQGLLPQ